MRKIQHTEVYRGYPLEVVTSDQSNHELFFGMYEMPAGVHLITDGAASVTEAMRAARREIDEFISDRAKFEKLSKES